MNKYLYIGIGVAIIGGGAAWYFMSQSDEEVYQLPNGVKGTAEQLIAQGYIPIKVGNNINWVSKAEYEKAQNQAGGNDSTLVTILNAAGAILPIVGSTISKVKNK